MKIDNSLNGTFPDVAYHNGELYVCYTRNEVYVYKWNGVSFDFIDFYECGGVGFARLTSYDGKLYLLYRPQSGQEIILKDVLNSTTISHSGIFYNSPAVFGKNVYAINNTGSDTCEVRNLLDDGVVYTSPSFPGTGIARFENSRVISVDDNRGLLAARGILNPEFAQEMICGEGISGGVGVLFGDSDKILLPNQTTFVPKITKYGNRWVIVTGDYNVINFIYDISAEDIVGEAPPIIPPIVPPNTQIINVSARVGDKVIINIV
jgi:hypothetical protein